MGEHVSALLRSRQGERNQRQFARDLGVSQALVCRLLAGRYRLGASAARRIAAAYPEMRGLLADAVGDAVRETPAATRMKETA